MDLEQPALPGMPRTRRRRAAGVQVADELPVARVLVDRPQPHLDRPFDYLVPAELADRVRAGVRVKVRFAGQDVDGWVVDRVAESEHAGRLTPLRRLVSAEVVLPTETLDLVTAVARRWAGTVADVLRLAVPPRHAAVEREEWPDGSVPPRPDVQDSAWQRTPGGPAFLRRVAAGEAPWAVWQALPWTVEPWADQVAQAVGAARAGGRGALVVVPSGAEVDLAVDALERHGVAPWRPGSAGGWVRLVADEGPAARYRAFLAAVRGAADVVVGTRAAAFAPVARLGLAVCWDDADPLHEEPRAPYPHAREVLAMRAGEGTALLVGGYSRSVAAQRWVELDRARPLVADRTELRRSTPRPVHLDRAELAREGPAAAARLPSAAWRTIRDGLEHGPVLVQVPRAGYLPAVACARCRTVARCATCGGPLRLAGSHALPACGWCGGLAGAWRCGECGHTGLRSIAVGAARTAEELGRAFPGVALRRSSAEHGVLRSVPAGRSLVVATTGAEPIAESGYAAAVLLDAQVTASRPGLDADQAALRHWLAAAALVRPSSEGGVAVLIGDVPAPLAGAFVRWDPAGLAERVLAERAGVQLPPAAHLVVLEGERAAVQAVADGLHVRTTVRGPIPTGPAPDGVLDPERSRPVRALLQTPWPQAAALVADLGAVLVTRSAAREGIVRVRVEPTDVG
ncbi:primosomal protein N' [Isoptericola sp. b490]|uniref:primosomal protein N' family DNA-binding protein n=1 Tax=Actinotalea lenta TaxID=3064654 RepID=UPI002712C273|nr:primosomal protein N' [Isoptericola sp. b490]MDO8120562.1 primosomal protein N' [Isoptericola sp. b490]